MQNMDDAANKRVSEHAKLFTVDGRQVLVMLQRAPDDALSVIVQVWVASDDHQLRAQIGTNDDEGAQVLFDTIETANLSLLIQELGINDAIAEVDRG